MSQHDQVAHTVLHSTELNLRPTPAAQAAAGRQ